MTDTWNGEPYDDDNGGWDMERAPRKRDLDGNIIDGAYADGKTKIIASEYPYDDWKAAYDGLRRIQQERRGLSHDLTINERNATIAAMTFTLIQRLGL
jgi:hypothetical protein